MNNNELYQAGLYCRLSKDDDQAGESVSIGTQRAILADYCEENHFSIHKFYIDDGCSGLNFNRPGFLELLADVESGAVNMVITKDLSRLGRDYIMTGYYSEVYFPSKNVRYIAISDGFDSLKHDNDIAPFKNILNLIYAKDLSWKVKNAKRQRAKQGLFIGSQTPYGCQRDPNSKNHLIGDPEAAETVRQILLLAEQGHCVDSGGPWRPLTVCIQKPEWREEVYPLSRGEEGKTSFLMCNNDQPNAKQSRLYRKPRQPQKGCR